MLLSVNKAFGCNISSFPIAIKEAWKIDFVAADEIWI